MAWRRIDIHRATERGDVAVLKRYLDSGGDAEKKDKEYGAAPVHWAALRGRLEALSLLLERGGNLESRTGTDGTPLAWGCMGGNAPVVRYLLERGANISAITKGKATALHHATHSGYPEVVSLLLAKGANPKAQDNRGERPGDKFDPEVSADNRRAIAKALSKATRGSSSSRRSSSSRSKRHPVDDISREGQPSSSSSLSRTKSRSASGDNNHGTVNSNDDGDGNHHDGKAGTKGPSLREDEEISAATAAAWTPKSPSRRPRPIAVPEEEPAQMDDVKALAAGEDEDGGWFFSPSSPRANGSNHVDGDRCPAAVSAKRPSSKEIDDLRRRVKDASLAAARAQDRDAESRASVRRALAEADEHAQTKGAAERARSNVLGALVQALEQRLREKDEQVDKLTAQLEDSNSRLRYREQEVLDLRKRIESLGSSDSPSAITAAPEASAAAPEPTASQSNGKTSGEESAPPPPFARGDKEERGENGGASDRRSCLRTRSSPTLSPPSGGGAQEPGRDWPRSRPGDGGDESPPGGGGRDGNRRSTIGPSTISADDSFGYALESLAARDGGAGRGGALQAGVLGWWRHGEWREENAGPAKSQPLHPPAPAVVEDQEHLGSLYSMIARR
eukprot:g6971.t1